MIDDVGIAPVVVLGCFDDLKKGFGETDEVYVGRGGWLFFHVLDYDPYSVRGGVGFG